MIVLVGLTWLILSPAITATTLAQWRQGRQDVTPGRFEHLRASSTYRSAAARPEIRWPR